MTKKMFGIIGGYGGIGLQVVENLLRIADDQILIGGRNVERAEAAASHFGSKVFSQVVDVNEPTSLNAFCQECSIVINCAGPSKMIFNKVAMAALQHKNHYIDSGGYEALYTALLAEEKEIRDKDLTFIVSAGMHPGLSEVFPVYIAQKYFDTVDSLTFYYAGRGKFSYNGAYDIANQISERLSKPLTYYDNGELLRREDVTPEEAILPSPVGNIQCQLIFKNETLNVVKACGARKAYFYNSFMGDFTGKTIFGIMTSKEQTTKERIERHAIELVNASIADMAHHDSCNMMHMELAGAREGEELLVEATIFDEDAYTLSGAVAASAGKLIRDGFAKRTGCSYLSEAVDVHQLMEHLEKLHISPTVSVVPK